MYRKLQPLLFQPKCHEFHLINPIFVSLQRPFEGDCGIIMYKIMLYNLCCKLCVTAMLYKLCVTVASLPKLPSPTIAPFGPNSRATAIFGLPNTGHLHEVADAGSSTAAKLGQPRHQHQVRLSPAPAAADDSNDGSALSDDAMEHSICTEPAMN